MEDELRRHRVHAKGIGDSRAEVCASSQRDAPYSWARAGDRYWVIVVSVLTRPIGLGRLSGLANVAELPQTSGVAEIDLELEQQVQAVYDDNGVDRSLIRQSLARTPAERLSILESYLELLATARRIAPPRTSMQ